MPTREIFCLNILHTYNLSYVLKIFTQRGKDLKEKSSRKGGRELERHTISDFLNLHFCRKCEMFLSSIGTKETCKLSSRDGQPAVTAVHTCPSLQLTH